MSKTLRSTFKIQYRTYENAKLGIIGNIPEFGEWNPNKCCLMNNDNYYNWFADLQFKSDRINLEIEFKFILIFADGTLKWEDGDNRVLKLKKSHFKLDINLKAFEFKWNFTKVRLILFWKDIDEGILILEGNKLFRGETFTNYIIKKDGKFIKDFDISNEDLNFKYKVKIINDSKEDYENLFKNKIPQEIPFREFNLKQKIFEDKESIIKIKNKDGYYLIYDFVGKSQVEEYKKLKLDLKNKENVLNQSKLQIIGKVQNDKCDPISECIISINGNHEYKTDKNGFFSFSSLLKETCEITAQHQDYFPFKKFFNPQNIEKNGVANFDIFLLPVQQTTIFSHQNANIREKEGNLYIDIQKNSFIDGNGHDFDGKVSMKIGFIDSNKQESLSTFSTFEALDSNGQKINLESFNAFNIEMKDEKGNPLKLKPNSQANVSIKVSNMNPNARFWIYDENKGVWNDLGQRGSFSNGFYNTSVSSSGRYNIDAPIYTSYSSGRIVNSAGNPMVGINIISRGLNYNSISHARSDENGYFKIQVKNDKDSKFELLYNNVMETKNSGMEFKASQQNLEIKIEERKEEEENKINDKMKEIREREIMINKEKCEELAREKKIEIENINNLLANSQIKIEKSDIVKLSDQSHFIQEKIFLCQEDIERTIMNDSNCISFKQCCENNDPNRKILVIINVPLEDQKFKVHFIKGKSRIPIYGLANEAIYQKIIKDPIYLPAMDCDNFTPHDITGCANLSKKGKNSIDFNKNIELLMISHRKNNIFKVQNTDNFIDDEIGFQNIKRFLCFCFTEKNQQIIIQQLK